jgi:hypothetical protein
MRYLSAIAVFLVFAALPLAAQHGGGGHASAGGHGGFASHGSFGGGHAFSGARSGSSGAPRAYHGPVTARGYSPRNFNSRGINPRSFNRGTNFRVRTYGLRNNCFGNNCRWGNGYPWLGAGIDPYWWWDGSSYDQDQQNQIGLAQQMDQQSLAEQQMRQQNDQSLYAHSAPPPPPHQEERTDPAPATVLVFRDQHQQEVRNYAIVGETLWTFAPQKTQKIPLDEIDIPATTKANDERGVDFRVPGAGEGQ